MGYTFDNIDGLHKFISFIPSFSYHHLHNGTFRRVRRGGIVLVQCVFTLAGINLETTINKERWLQDNAASVKRYGIKLIQN